ncbi:MAG: RNA-binding protein [Armatimonadota bacterium]
MANKSIYVGNLPYSTTDEELKSVFDPYGPVSDVRLIPNKGFGFVDIPEENIAKAVESTHGLIVGGRNIVVNEAKPKPDRQRKNYSQKY